jgi:formate-dependent nitrite reductase cytochrome c552 subunit
MRARASQRDYNVAYYQRNRDLEIERVRVRQAGMVELLRDLRRVPCADCGGRFKPHQMDFDHREPSTKSFTVMSGRAMLMPTATVLAEVAKCDVVCVNCHRVRTRRQHRVRLAVLPRGSSARLAEKRAGWRRQAALLDRLRDVACADCGGRFPPCSMDFDHRDPSQKRSRVTAMIGRAGDQRILEEVARCDIVCANCHRTRTFERRHGSVERE